MTDSERFYNSVLELLEDPEEQEEVEAVMVWWNRYVQFFYLLPAAHWLC